MKVSILSISDCNQHKNVCILTAFYDYIWRFFAILVIIHNLRFKLKAFVLSGLSNSWRGVRVAEGARLEIVYGVKLIEGSTPSLSVCFLFIIQL